MVVREGLHSYRIVRGVVREIAKRQETTRWVMLAALSNPSPTTITPVAYLIPVKHTVSYLSVREG